MQTETNGTSQVKEKVMQVLAALRTNRPYATGIEVTAEEQTFKWKAPPGFGWSKTSDPKVAIASSTKRLHVVIASGTGDLYFYK
ncbi:MAG TPA: hypothetical protein VKM55_13255 [Candidatus Lokiarchaeia archaeon]|nr:hypothetical protein [Candidatus Lokiarchaeia archaeon]